MSLAVQESISTKPPPEALMSDRPPQSPDQKDPQLTASDEPFLDAGIDISNKLFIDERERRMGIYHEDVKRHEEGVEIVLPDTTDEGFFPHFY